MARTGLTQKQRKALAVMELDYLAEEFAYAMRVAKPSYIARKKQTARMKLIWRRYIDWNRTYEKDFV
jgi:hypothetical protein